MTFLPIVVRELRVAARRQSTYRVRFWTACVAAGICSYLILQTRAMMGRAQGAMIFSVLAALCFLSCLSLAGNTIDCISEEKRGGTLGFLFLTDLKGHDIALGKLFSSSLISFYALVAMFPVAEICLLLGGVSAISFWEAALALLNVFFFSQCAGLFVSAITVKKGAGATGATLILGAYTLGFFSLSSLLEAKGFRPLASVFETMNPGFSVHWACTTGFGWRPPGSGLSRYWTSLLLIHLNAWAFLALASFWLPRSWQEKPRTRKAGWRERLRLWYHSRFTPRGELLDRNPFLWLTVRNRLGPLKVWLTLAIIVSGCLWWSATSEGKIDVMPVVVVAIVSSHLILRILFASDVTSNMEEQRRNGSLELILSCTPLDVDGIIQGQWLALRRQFLGPALAVVAADFLATSIACGNRSSLHGNDDITNFVFFVLAMMAMLAADMVAMGWVGMWQAMSQKRPRHAAGATIFRVMIVPWLLLFLFGLLSAGAHASPIGSFGGALLSWLIVGLLTDFVAVVLVREKLYSQFRELAAVQPGETLGFFGAFGRMLGSVMREGKGIANHIDKGRDRGTLT